MQAALFRRLREYYQKRDRLRLILDYLKKYLNSLLRGGECVAGEQTHQFQRHALIHEHFHRRAFSRVSSCAPVSTATAAARVTVGKFSRNSSSEQSLSRCSNSDAAGTRVPRNTGSPPRISGSATMWSLSALLFLNAVAFIRQFKQCACLIEFASRAFSTRVAGHQIILFWLKFSAVIYFL